MTDFKKIKDTAISEIELTKILPYFLKVTDYDESPDLTEVHPKERTDLNLFFLKDAETLLPKTFDLVKQNQKILEAVVLGLAPRSQVYKHVDRMDLGPYAQIDWTSVLLPLDVPEQTGLKIENNIYSVNEIIEFDAQIPHSAWNHSDSWWTFIRLRVLKD